MAKKLLLLIMLASLTACVPDRRPTVRSLTKTLEVVLEDYEKGRVSLEPGPLGSRILRIKVAIVEGKEASE
jgi:hypothetical protein